VNNGVDAAGFQAFRSQVCLELFKVMDGKRREIDIAELLRID